MAFTDGCILDIIPSCYSKHLIKINFFDHLNLCHQILSNYLRHEAYAMQIPFLVAVAPWWRLSWVCSMIRCPLISIGCECLKKKAAKTGIFLRLQNLQGCTQVVAPSHAPLYFPLRLRPLLRLQHRWQWQSQIQDQVRFSCLRSRGPTFEMNGRTRDITSLYIYISFYFWMDNLDDTSSPIFAIWFHWTRFSIQNGRVLCMVGLIMMALPWFGSNSLGMNSVPGPPFFWRWSIGSKLPGRWTTRRTRCGMSVVCGAPVLWPIVPWCELGGADSSKGTLHVGNRQP